MWEIYKNDILVPYEDAGGETNQAFAGETRLGVDLFTGDELAPLDTILSRRFICGRCGYPTPKEELIKQAGFWVCERCIDE